MEANIRALQTGYFFGDTTETFQHRYRIRPATLPPGTYRKVTGNEAMAMGLVTAAHKMNKPLFYGTYPITPASDILHALAPLRNFDVRDLPGRGRDRGHGLESSARPSAARWPSPAPAAPASPSRARP